MPSATIALKRCTAETVPAFLEFIAQQNSLLTQHCLILDQNVEGIRNDLSMIEAEPTERFWGLWDGGALVAAVGLDIEVRSKRTFFLGPWAKDEQLLQPVMEAMMEFIPEEINELRTYHNVDAAASHNAALACGFSDPTWATYLVIKDSFERGEVAKLPPPAGFAVRLQDPSDAAVTPTLLALHHQLFPKSHNFADEKWPKLDGTLGWLFAVFNEDSERPEHPVPVGYAIVQREGTSNKVYVQYVGVAPSEQGKGRGTALLLAIKEWFYEQGFEQLSLTVNGDNPNARKMYLNVGFKIESDGCGYKFFRRAAATQHAKEEDTGV
ncbi:hypothetical protein HDU87_008710 [Geranomyces variabilis]|uniref:N-acetyltransferase domain-containing protein n=1 Tax=Geranomyces variabilis TaxID=109894 RepID=A0AAD5TEY4_9FUNG|nr:hypothetical protein HDU87_008710 [Geranomyces variabilis]